MTGSTYTSGGGGAAGAGASLHAAPSAAIAARATSLAFTPISHLPSSPPALPRQDVQLQPDVLRQADQLAAAVFDAQQCVQADRVRRHELVELEDRRPVGRARLQQVRHFLAGEPPREVHDDAIVVASDGNLTV